jgi:hypothetical protein
MSYQPMASLPLRVPSPMTLRKSIKCPKRASKLIKKLLGNEQLISVSKAENRTIISFYIKSKRCDWHNWGFNYQTNVEVRKQPAKTYAISNSVALVNLIDTPKIVLALETDFAR